MITLESRTVATLIETLKREMVNQEASTVLSEVALRSYRSRLEQVAHTLTKNLERRLD